MVMVMMMMITWTLIMRLTSSKWLLCLLSDPMSRLEHQLCADQEHAASPGVCVCVCLLMRDFPLLCCNDALVDGWAHDTVSVNSSSKHAHLVGNSRLICLMLFHTLKRLSVKLFPLLQLYVVQICLKHVIAAFIEFPRLMWFLKGGKCHSSDILGSVCINFLGDLGQCLTPDRQRFDWLTWTRVSAYLVIIYCSRPVFGNMFLICFMSTE